MANNVFADGREISCKSGDGKSLCSFPDVCMTPPENPATPPGVPVPYPNTGMASDTTDGSKSVQISGKEVMLKNKSYFKQSMGDEAGCTVKNGVVTSVNRGKIYFIAWSMDVKVEGENAVRHLDMTTHNHASFPSNTGPWPYVDTMALEPGGACHAEREREKTACEGQQNPCPPDGKPKSESDAIALADKVAANACLDARRCKLVPYDPSGCCEGQTPHHIVEASSFFDVGRGGSETLKDSNKNPIGYRTSIPVKGTAGYNTAKAPCICVEGVNQHHGTHGLMHTFQGTAAQNSRQAMTIEYDCSAVDLTQASRQGVPQIATNLDERGFHWHRHGMQDGKVVPLEARRTDHGTSYGRAKQQGIAAAQTVFPNSGCSQACLEAQLDNYHSQHGIESDTRIRACEEGHTGAEAVDAANAEILRRSQLAANAAAGAPTSAAPGV